MELRGAQEKELGMPSSFKLSSFAPINPPPRTLDHHTESNPERRIDNPRRDSDQDQDPVSAPVPTYQPTTVVGPSPTSRAINISSSSSPLIRYRECLKNHAAGMGGHVVDGCGEFMPSGEDGTQEALKCAACECHRNFHRKEINGESQYPMGTCFTYNPHKNNTRRDGTIVHPQPQQQPMPIRQQRVPINGSSNGPRLPIAPPPVMMNFGIDDNGGGRPADSSSEERNMFDSNARGTGRSSYPQSSKKRFRTKFSGDQKDKMMEFAEKLGWRIQKQDEQELQQFCCEVGIKRQVFKVWMHNSKQAMKRKKM